MKGSKKNVKRGKKEKDEAYRAAEPETEPQSEEQAKIIEFLKKVKFRKKIIGGLDARSVWKKLEELNRLYDAAIRAEKIRADAVLMEYKRTASVEIGKRDETIGRLKDVIAKHCPEPDPERESDQRESDQRESDHEEKE